MPPRLLLPHKHYEHKHYEHKHNEHKHYEKETWHKSCFDKQTCHNQDLRSPGRHKASFAGRSLKMSPLFALEVDGVLSVERVIIRDIFTRHLQAPQFLRLLQIRLGELSVARLQFHFLVPFQ